MIDVIIFVIYKEQCGSITKPNPQPLCSTVMHVTRISEIHINNKTKYFQKYFFQTLILCGRVGSCLLCIQPVACASSKFPLESISLHLRHGFPKGNVFQRSQTVLPVVMSFKKSKWPLKEAHSSLTYFQHFGFIFHALQLKSVSWSPPSYT